MIIDKIDETRLLISLAYEDMQSFNLRFDQFLWSDSKSRNIIKDLLQKAKEQTGFCANNKRMMIEVLPKSGGCIILFTLLFDKAKKVNHRYRIKRKCKCFIYEFETSEYLIRALERIFNLKPNLVDSKIILYNKLYYLILYSDNALTIPLNLILSEYGYYISSNEIYMWDIFKYGTTISSTNAIYDIGNYFNNKNFS